MIIINEFKMFFRDKMAVSFMIAFPIILIYLLGSLLTNQDYADSAIGNLRIGYMVDTTNQLEIAVIQDFIKESEKTGSIQFIKITDKKAAQNKVAKEKLEGFVLFEEGTIHIYEGKDAVKNRTISALITGYANITKAFTSITYNAPQKLANLKNENSNFIKEKEFNANRTMLDYYGVTMIIMMVFVGSIQGAFSFGDEIKLKTANRLIVSPLSRSNIFIQKVIGQIPSAFISVLIVMITSVLLFHVHYASTIQDNIILFLFFLVSNFTMVMIGVVVGLFVTANPVLVLMPALWVMMFIGGTFTKELSFKGVTELMPVYQLQQAAFDLTVFGRSGKTIRIMLLELMIIIVMFLIGVIRFNKMKEAK